MSDKILAAGRTLNEDNLSPRLREFSNISTEDINAAIAAHSDIDPDEQAGSKSILSKDEKKQLTAIKKNNAKAKTAREEREEAERELWLKNEALVHLGASFDPELDDLDVVLSQFVAIGGMENNSHLIAFLQSLDDDDKEEAREVLEFHAAEQSVHDQSQQKSDFAQAQYAAAVRADEIVKESFDVLSETIAADPERFEQALPFIDTVMEASGFPQDAASLRDVLHRGLTASDQYSSSERKADFLNEFEKAAGRWDLDGKSPDGKESIPIHVPDPDYDGIDVAHEAPVDRYDRESREINEAVLDNPTADLRREIETTAEAARESRDTGTDPQRARAESALTGFNRDQV